MNCPKCGSQMTLLLFSSVCDRCDPPASIGQSVKAAVEEGLVFYAVPRRKVEGAEYNLFQTLEAVAYLRKTVATLADPVPVRIVSKDGAAVDFDANGKSTRPYRVFSSEFHLLSVGLKVYGVWAD